MLRFRLQELLAEKQFREGHRVTMTELALVTGINRVTLSKMVNQRGYSTVTDNLDQLCRYFNCRIEQLVEYVPDEVVPPIDAGVPTVKEKSGVTSKAKATVTKKR